MCIPSVDEFDILSVIPFSLLDKHVNNRTANVETKK